jgi:serine/threonine protein kinase
MRAARRRERHHEREEARPEAQTRPRRSIVATLDQAMTSGGDATLHAGSEAEREPEAARPAAFVVERLPRPFGKFVLKRRLARGGMAEVFLASLSGAQGFEKELVVKLIRPELAADEGFVARFVDEAKTCVKLTHPNIVSIFELGVETGVLYLAMELVRGATLAELLQDGGAVRGDEGAYIALEVARALDHAHRRGVIHRDVTPGNVMLDEEGGVKLLDFGIAAPAGLDVEVFGTPGHMPPEQIEGRPLSASADLFSLGTVLVEAWTGRAPYRRADARASRTALLEGPPPPPSATLPELAPLDELVTALLEIAPDRRPQHADDVARVLRKHLRERNVDLDEVARGLAKRVRQAMVSREEREAGRPPKSAPMPKTMRPTPLGEASKTFATRGEIATWSGPSTRRVEHEDTGRVRAVPPDPALSSGTRRLDEPEPARAPEIAAGAAPPPPRRSLGPPVILLAVAGIAVLAFVQLRAVLSPGTTSGSTASTSAIPLPGTSAPVGSTASLPSSASATSTTALPSATASASASASAMAANAKLVITSSPPARVELDGRPLGRTPINTTAPLGDHRLVLRPDGLGESFERKVTLTATSGMDVHGDFNDEPTITFRRIPSK